MAKRSKKNASEENVIEFVLEELDPVSSPESLKKAPAVEQPAQAVEGEAVQSAEADTQNVSGTSTETISPVEEESVQEKASEILPVSLSRAATELELPKLPVFGKQNRARLQVQSPNSVHFYWSVKTSPFHTLSKTLGSEAASYSIALRFLDTETEREEIHPAEPEGTYWFNTDAGRTYRAEIGLYSPSRPFVRILYSNTVTTPRKAPSPRAASQSEWRLTSHKFAEVLNVTGFTQDAFDVAVAGDDGEEADQSTHAAFEQLLGHSKYSREDVTALDIRSAMMAIASGQALEKLRWKIGPALFAVLQANAERLGPRNAAAAVSKHLDLDETEFEAEEFGAALAGSLINFPGKFRTRRPYSPLSSHSFH